MRITDLVSNTHYPIDAFADLVVENLYNAESFRLRISTDYSIGYLLDNVYYFDLTGDAHLDLREFLHQLAIFRPPLPSLQHPIGDSLTCAQFYFAIYQDTDWDYYSCFIDLFSDAHLDKSTEAEACTPSKADILRIPKDYQFIIPVTSPVDNGYFVKMSATLISNRMRVPDIFQVSFSINGWYEKRINKAIPASEIPMNLNEPFYLLIKWWLEDEEGIVRSNDFFFRTPLYEAVNGQFEQYAFLNEYGAFDNIAMDGALAYAPEYDIQTAQFQKQVTKVSSSVSGFYSQSAGNLSAKTAAALADLLLSDDIYHFDRETSTWRRIIVEAPTVNVSSTDPSRSVTFKWRYSEQ